MSLGSQVVGRYARSDLRKRYNVGLSIRIGITFRKVRRFLQYKRIGTGKIPVPMNTGFVSRMINCPP